MIGEMIAHYRVTAKLGEGGMGIVYRATDSRLDREVAIKVLPPEVANTPDWLARFEREAKTLALVNHPNIAAVYGVEQGALVMELVEGPTLADRMDAGVLPLEEIIAIAKQIAEALEAAHEKGIVHRDLKPNNVKITPEGAVKLLDFGLAKAVENAKQGIVLDPVNSPTIVAGSIAGVIMGTAGYMSPEQAKGQAVDKRTDIWAFGVVLHEMLTGRRLFDDGTVAEAIADILRRGIDLKELPASTPPAIRNLVRRCLDRNVKTRLRDIGEARIALGEALTPEEAPRVEPRPLSRLWVISAALAGLTIGGLVAWSSKREPTPQAVQLDLRMPAGLTPSAERGTLGVVRMSPDGTSVAFVSRGSDNKPMVWLRRLASDRVQPLQGTENALFVFWSPDSRSIGFLADEKLKKMDIGGGPVSVITECPDCNAFWCEGNTIFFYSRLNRGLQRISATGGTSAPAFTDVDGENEYSFRPLPDGKSLVHGKRVPKAGGDIAASIVFRTLDGRMKRTLFEHLSSPVEYTTDAAGRGYLLYVLNNQLTAHPFDAGKGEFNGEPFVLSDRALSGNSWSVSRNGVIVFFRQSMRRNQLVWIDHEGRHQGPVGDVGGILSPRISPNQQMVAYGQLEEGVNYSVMLLDLKTGLVSRLAQSEGRDPAPVWSTNGDAIFYSLGRGTKRVLARRTPGGSSVDQVIASTPDGLAPATVSSDGRWLLANQNLRNNSTAFLFSLANPGQPEQILKEYVRTSRVSRASFSPNGRWLVFTGLHRDRFEVFVVPSPKSVGGSGDTSMRWQISQNGGVQPVWSGNGKEIFFLSEGMLMSAAVTATDSEFRVAPPVPLFAVNETDYDASADGKKFLFVQPLSGSSDEVPMSVIVNWPRLKDRR